MYDTGTLYSSNIKCGNTFTSHCFEAGSQSIPCYETIHHFSGMCTIRRKLVGGGDHIYAENGRNTLEYNQDCNSLSGHLITRMVGHQNPNRVFIRNAQEWQ